LDLKLKIILSFLLLVSLILFEYSPIEALQQSSNLSEYIPIDTTPLWLEIFAILILYFVVFCIIWSLPTQRQRQRQEKHKEKEVGFETDKASTQPFKEKNVDEMIENGYALNVETGKWEKPIKPRKGARAKMKTWEKIAVVSLLVIIWFVVYFLTFWLGLKM
jgi:flagellar biosynthesis/type III secretory pathway M-ring protein FliF/YscJ